MDDKLPQWTLVFLAFSATLAVISVTYWAVRTWVT